MKVLVTGAAGFIGAALVKALVTEGHEVVGMDNINDYYAQSIKYARLTDAGIDTSTIAEGQSVMSTHSPGYQFV